MLESFLKRFYETISFFANEPFKAEAFRSLFDKDAVLIEQQEQGMIQKTVDVYIQEFEQTILTYPQVSAEGFQERQLSYEVIEEETHYLVSSHYEKCYHRFGETLCEQGIDTMMISKQTETLKISMIHF